jgi:putative nucleotidyltransferase with HDIG domain
MEQNQLAKFRVWFKDYVAGFYGNNERVNANLRMKEEHSLRVCDEMRYLADELGLTDNQRRIAEVTALFHDIGRFKQFVKYRTYNDVKSVNHGLLGLDVLRETGVLGVLDGTERQLIEKAIEYHGIKELPSSLDGECLLFSRLIRDADKLDIFYVVTEYYKEYRDHPENFMLELDFPDKPGYSTEVVEEILCGRRVNYDRLRTFNDMKILQLGWVYDVNFTATLKRIRHRRFLEKVIEFLPETEDIKRVEQKVFGYVDSRISNNC